MVRWPPLGIASRALIARLVSAASSCAGSATTGQISAASSSETSIRSPSVRPRSLTIPLMRSLMAMRCGCSGCRRAKARRLRVRSAPRCAASRAWRASLLGGAAFLAVEQIVEIAGKLAQGLHFLRLQQLLLALLQGRAGLFPVVLAGPAFVLGGGQGAHDL